MTGARNFPALLATRHTSVLGRTKTGAEAYRVNFQRAGLTSRPVWPAWAS